MTEVVTIEKLVFGGQGLGQLADGRKVFVWNVLPEETVSIEVIKSRKSYAEGVVEEIITPSKDRIKPAEDNYLATSPWQIMKFDTENLWKQKITQEIFVQTGIEFPKFKVITDGVQFHYRNKMEYSFWGDDDGLHLALYNRGSHQKQIVEGSALAMSSIDKAAQALLSELNKKTIRAGDLKTMIVRSDQRGNTVAALYTKLEKFHKMELPNELTGMRVYHSNPKSPASVRTKLIYELGDSTLKDNLLDKEFSYDVDSFFQVNVPVFEKVLEKLNSLSNYENLLDMYAGVGSIGISLANNSVELVESDDATSTMALVNAANCGIKASVTKIESEKALDYITKEKAIIFDPPRAGLSIKIIDRIIETKPPKIIYLSCNPATQARDISLLKNEYKITLFETYNFFPRTPHIESLAILESL